MLQQGHSLLAAELLANQIILVLRPALIIVEIAVFQRHRTHFVLLRCGTEVGAVAAGLSHGQVLHLAGQVVRLRKIHIGKRNADQRQFFVCPRCIKQGLVPCRRHGVQRVAGQAKQPIVVAVGPARVGEQSHGIAAGDRKFLQLFAVFINIVEEIAHNIQAAGIFHALHLGGGLLCRSKAVNTLTRCGKIDIRTIKGHCPVGFIQNIAHLTALPGSVKRKSGGILVIGVSRFLRSGRRSRCLRSGRRGGATQHILLHKGHSLVRHQKGKIKIRLADLNGNQKGRQCHHQHTQHHKKALGAGTALILLSPAQPLFFYCLVHFIAPVRCRRSSI